MKIIQRVIWDCVLIIIGVFIGFYTSHSILKTKQEIIAPKEQKVKIPLSGKHIYSQDGHYRCSFMNEDCNITWYEEINQREAIQMIIDYLGIKYVPEQTSSTPAKLIK